jgi:predicted membrane protein
MNSQFLLKKITNPLGAAIILTIVATIMYILFFDTKKCIKFMIYIFILSYAIIYINNEYIITDFEKEKTIPGTYP